MLTSRASRLLGALVILGCGAPTMPDPLIAIRDRGDHAAMRVHGWATWAALADGDTPVWTRWTPSEQLLGGAPRGARPRLRTPRPFRNGDALDRETLPVMFDVLFDAPAAAHVATHGLGRKATLAQIARAAAFPAFPKESLAVKLVWYPVHRGGLTAMPIWDGEPAQPDAAGNPDRTWTRAIAVDPSARTIGPDETAEVELAGRTLTAHVVALAAFIHETLDTDDQVASARTAAHDVTLARGDSIALVAVHVSTKAIPDWTWVTLWWHDRPDAGPYAAGRPAALPGAFGNYLMDVALSSSGACFNPWLEARFPNGLASNCVTCHQRAVIGATDYLPVTMQPLAVADPYFVGRPQTDFVWSLALEAR